MNYFKLGCNFDEKLITGIKELNEEFPSDIISEVYGSDRDHHQLTARPWFRLQDIDKKKFEKYVKSLLDLNVWFNYTANSTLPYITKEALYDNKNQIQDFVKFLSSIGVKRITIANPLLLEIIREVSDIEIEISTCMHIDAVSQIKYYHETYNVNKVCCNILKNRNFKFLSQAAKYCNDNGVIFEVMLNEFCGVGGNGYATHCVYRDSCYNYHASNTSKEDALLFDNYPMNRCMCARDSDLENWLRMRFVRPEDLDVYNKFGVNHFKISGRTGATDYLLSVARDYMSHSHEGNLISLWKPLESIYDESFTGSKLFIDNKKLDGFIDHWANNLNFNCDNEICGETCTYCHDFYSKVIGG